MPRPSQVVMEPRKSPVQARSTASVDAILQATIQVLLSIGKDHLTTTRVAHRAGVSVGTLYQYFPNKTSLLQAVLSHHLEDVTSAVEKVCLEQKGQPLQQMAPTLINGFLAAKMRNPKISAALYSISSDLDAARIVQQLGNRTTKAIVAMLESSSDRLTNDPQLVAAMLQGAMVGVSRRLLETPSPEKHLEAVRSELIFLAKSYLEACSTPCSHNPNKSAGHDRPGAGSPDLSLVV